MVERGELWWAELGEPRGSAPGTRRPVLVVSPDAFNRSRIKTAICMTITSNLRLAEAPGNVVIAQETSGLRNDSVANVSQVVTVDKNDLVERLGRIDRATMRRVDAGLRRVLGLA